MDGEGNVIFTKTDEIFNWGRESSLWYLLFGLACCAIEMMQTGGPRADLDRFGSVFRATPRQSDLMIVAGTLTYKMAIRTKLLSEQMPDPKYVISMGSCSNCGGLFEKAYSVVKGVDQIIHGSIRAIFIFNERSDGFGAGHANLQRPLQYKSQFIK